MNIPKGRYRYVKIDLTACRHVAKATPLFFKDPDGSEVSPEHVGPFAGVSLAEMDIDDIQEYPPCPWKPWIAWLWRMFNRSSKQTIGPIRYFFVQDITQ
jgi:hypothetical protein